MEYLVLIIRGVVLFLVLIIIGVIIGVVLNLVLIIIGVVLYPVMYRKSQVATQKPKYEERQFDVQLETQESTGTEEVSETGILTPEEVKELQEALGITETSEPPPEPESKNDNKNKGEESAITISCKNPNCRQKLRIPITEKMLKITCPICRNIFYYPEVIEGTKEEASKTKQVANKEYCAYLDIETTSLNPYNGDLTVIGLCLEDANDHRIIQLVGDDISASKLIEIMKRVEVLYTYNGSRFDIPYIKAKIGIDITKYCAHKDLMIECWQRNLYGGLKEVERKLGIKRKLTGVDGRIAAELWRNYKFYGDRDSLTTLLEYNREDVFNLRVIRQKLNI